MDARSQGQAELRHGRRRRRVPVPRRGNFPSSEVDSQNWNGMGFPTVLGAEAVVEEVCEAQPPVFVANDTAATCAPLIQLS